MINICLSYVYHILLNHFFSDLVTEHKENYFYIPFLNPNPVEHHAKCSFTKNWMKRVSLWRGKLCTWWFYSISPLPLLIYSSYSAPENTKTLTWLSLTAAWYGPCQSFPGNCLAKDHVAKLWLMHGYQPTKGAPAAWCKLFVTALPHNRPRYKRWGCVSTLGQSIPGVLILLQLKANCTLLPKGSRTTHWQHKWLCVIWQPLTPARFGFPACLVQQHSPQCDFTEAMNVPCSSPLSVSTALDFCTGCMVRRQGVSRSCWWLLGYPVPRSTCGWKIGSLNWCITVTSALSQ